LGRPRMDAVPLCETRFYDLLDSAPTLDRMPVSR
jgi:hypothetical protein